MEFAQVDPRVTHHHGGLCMVMVGYTAEHPQDAIESARVAADPPYPIKAKLRAKHPRCPCLRRDHAPLRRAAGNLEHQLLARRVLELLAFLDWNDERARPTDDAILVIDVEI